MRNNKQSGNKTIKIASNALHDINSSNIQKILAGSIISQTNTSNQTSKDMEKIASDVLKSNKYNDDTKSMAASLLSQSNKNR